MAIIPAQAATWRPGFVIAPLVPLVVAMAAGIACDQYSDWVTTDWWIGIGLAFGIIASLAVGRAGVSSLAILLAMTATGGAWHHWRSSDLDPDDATLTVTEEPRPAWVRGVVREALGIRKVPGFGFGDPDRITTRFVLALEAICDGEQWSEVSGRAILTVAGDRRDVQAGRAVQAAGQLARVGRPLNPGEFDYRAYLQAHGIRLRLTVDEPDSLWLDPAAAGDVIAGWLGKLKEWSHERLVERLDPAIAPLAAALVLGQREEVEPEVNDAFALTGTTHLLAISGLQLQALAAALLLLLRLIGVPRRLSYWAVGLTMAGYAVVVGLAPSVVRSTVMTSTFCMAAVAHRMARPANTLALAALATLTINPSFLFDIGCQLSFLAIAAIVWLVPPACRFVLDQVENVRQAIWGPRSPLDDLERQLEPGWRRLTRVTAVAILDGIVGSTVVWVAALPLVAWRFHIVSAIGILLNIPLIPVTSAALLLSGSGLLLSAIWGPLGTVPAWGAGWLLRATEQIVFWGSRQPWGHRFVVGPRCEWVIMFYILLVVAAVAASSPALEPAGSRPSWWKRRLVWWLLVAWFVPGWLLSDQGATAGTPAAEFLAVGHGLAVIVQTPSGQCFLYDCGALGDATVGRRIVARALWSRGVARIESVLLSHADRDHYGGLADLLDRFEIGGVKIPPGFAGNSNPGAVELIDQVRSRGIPVETLAAGDAWESAGVRFTVQHPPLGWRPQASDNARSLVIDIAHQGRHVVLTGDLEQEGLLAYVDRPPVDPPPDVLLSPHHGGKSANPEWLYRWARPRQVIVSQRAPVSPGSDALAVLERQGIPVSRTWRQGAIRVQWASDGLTARGFLEEDKKVSTSDWIVALNGIGTMVLALPDLRVTMRVVAVAAGLGLGAVACLVLAVMEFGAWALVAPRRLTAGPSDDAFGSSPSALASPVELISVRASDGALLAGRWFPTGREGMGGRAVLLLHGFAEGVRALEAQRVATLNHHGWNVAALDSRGYGQSEGPHASFGGHEAGDLRAWIDFLSERLGRTDTGTPFQPALWGRSMGAAIAVRAAAADPRVIALVLESPMVDLDTSLAVVLRRRGLPFPRLLARLVLYRAGKLAGVSLRRPRPIDLAPRLACPTLIVHGTDDTLVGIDEARRLTEAFTTPPQWLDVAGAGHTNVIDMGGEPLFEKIASFLDESSRQAQIRHARGASGP